MTEKKAKEAKEKVEDLNSKEVRAELYDEKTGRTSNSRGRGRSDKEKKEIYARYRAIKKKAVELEARNKEYLILFPASDFETNEKKTFYTMGGTSAIIYVHDLAPKVKRRATLRRDHDQCNDAERFHSGVCSIQKLEAFEESMRTLGVVKAGPFKDYEELLMYKLPREYSHAEVKEMFKEEQKNLDNLNKTLFSTVLYPDVHKQILELKKTIPPKVKNMDKTYREVVGMQMIGSLRDLTRTYSQMAHGDMPEREAAEEMRLELDAILDDISWMNELKLWEISSCIRVAEIAVSAKMLLKARILNKHESKEQE